MAIIKYVRYDIDFIKNMPDGLLAELITLDEPIPDNFQSWILDHNPNFRKERSEFIGRHNKILEQTWETRHKTDQLIKKSVREYLVFELEEDIGFIKKYPQFKPIISHIEFWDNESKVIVKNVPLDEYLAEN